MPPPDRAPLCSVDAWARSEWHGGIVWRVITTCSMAMCECVCGMLLHYLSDSRQGECDSGFQALAGVSRATMG